MSNILTDLYFEYETGRIRMMRKNQKPQATGNWTKAPDTHTNRKAIAQFQDGKISQIELLGIIVGG